MYLTHSNTCYRLLTSNGDKTGGNLEEWHAKLMRPCMYTYIYECMYVCMQDFCFFLSVKNLVEKTHKININLSPLSL